MNREEQTYSTNTGEFIAEKLLPCPFCGGEPEFITIGNDYTKSRKAEIKCTNCFVKRTTGAIRNDLEWCGRKAIELWNKRTNSLSLPPAEGAEAFVNKYYNLPESKIKLVRIGSLIKCVERFATLHAQRIADKMVEEKLREGLIAYGKVVRSWGIAIPSDILECSIDEYLKTREK